MGVRMGVSVSMGVGVSVGVSVGVAPSAPISFSPERARGEGGAPSGDKGHRLGVGLPAAKSFGHRRPTPCASDRQAAVTLEGAV